MDDDYLDHLPFDRVPTSAVKLFRMSWQLEFWLRAMVYVELRGRELDWRAPIVKVAPKQPQVLQNDKRLRHMATHEDRELSYLTLGELWKLISAEENWPLFENYLMPKENVLARIDEIKTIRNRVAHCRVPHSNDEARLALFLRDLDSGLRAFCLRYRSPAPRVSNDPVAVELVSRWSQYGYATELYSPDVGWLYAEGPHRMEPRIRCSLRRHCRVGHENAGAEGTIYRLDLSGAGAATLDLSHVLEGIFKWEDDVIHMLVPSPGEVQVTIPLIRGVTRVVEIIGDFLQRAVNAVGLRRVLLGDIMARPWPDCVLWPNHPLSCFAEEYTGMIFELPES